MWNETGIQLGPGEGLPAVFVPYLMAVASVAAERGDPDVATLVSRSSGVDVRLAELPITSVGGAARVTVEIRLDPVEPEVVPDAEATADRLTDWLNEMVDRDGYRVARITLDD
jgi:hypothetical protein